MGRQSIASQLENNFGINYNELLKKLHEEDKLKPYEISEYIKNKYNVNIQATTINIHINQLKTSTKKNKKSTEDIFSEKGLSYREILLSYVNLSKEEISEKIFQKYNINIKPGTIYAHARNYGIKIEFSKQIGNIHSISEQIENSKPIYKSGCFNSNLLIDSNNHQPLYFLSSNDSGFIVLEQLNGIVEITSYLEIVDRSKAYVNIYLTIYKDNLSELTNIIHSIDVPNNTLNEMTSFNYVKHCKNLCCNYVNKLKSMGSNELKSILIEYAKNKENMKQIISRCTWKEEETK